MTLSILYFGDVVGEAGINAIALALPELVESYKPDLLFANIENISQGRGVHPIQYQQMLALGFDAFTSGDHVWHYKETPSILDGLNSVLLRPANYYNSPGRGHLDLEVKGKRLRLICLQGRVFMSSNLNNPFKTFDDIYSVLPKPDLVFVDFHAEATSEKRSFLEYVLGRAQLVVGTHTHVPTADAQIFNNQTAFISDLGMNGPQDSCLGAEKEPIMKSFLTGLPWRYNLGKGECELGLIHLMIDLNTDTPLKIEHIRRNNNCN